MLFLTNFIKKYWKYMVCFFFGVFLTCLVPSLPINGFLKKGYKYINKKETEIQVLKDANNKFEGQNQILKRDKEAIEKRIPIMQQKMDSLNEEIKKQNDILEKINNEYEKIDNITNFNDKQLHQFFADYEQRRKHNK